MTDTGGTRMMLRTMTVFVVLTVLHTPAIPSGKEHTAQPAATPTNGAYRPFLVNNVLNYYGNNGDGSYNPFTRDNEGFEFVRGTNKHIMFEDGLLWGGFHKGRATPKVGGSVYRHGLQPGPLLTPGTPTTGPLPADPTDPRYRVYSVRPDVRPDIPFAAVEAMLTGDEIPSIVRYESVTALGLYDRYIADWNAWPAALGAPFTDVDKNGAYDPAVDVPGRPGADQTLWYVANDMNDSLTQILAGCPPIGLEVRRTIWGYRGNGALSNTIFISTVLINKSGAPVDSMFITQWSDPDLGDGGNDHVGCDTTLDLAYTYNGALSDPTYGTAVPAAGFALLQGPMVPGDPADTALFLSSRRPGFRDLRMSSFALFTSGSIQFADPAQGVNGDVQWYRVMNGTAGPSGVPFIDLNTNRPTAFCASGDPVRSTDGSAGWVDGTHGYFPSDRRMCMSTGPFTLANGDTQEVVIATLASQGTDRLASIGFLRSDVRTVQTAFRRSPSSRRIPPVSSAVTSDSASAAITCRIDARNDGITAASIALTTQTGTEVATITLADDGLHADGTAGDGIWAGTAHIPVRSSVLNGSALLTYAGGEEVRWENVLYHITTVRLSVTSFGVVSDNINSDGIVNPGENVRYVFALKNDSPFDLAMLTIHPNPFAENGSYTIPVLPGRAAFRPRYNGTDPVTYFFFDVPAGHTDSTVHVEIRTTDDSLNVWRHTLGFPVRPLPGTPYATPLAHATGKASGAYTIQIVDPARIKDHLYVLRGVDSASAIGSFSLKDSTTGTVLIPFHPFPDELGHTSPVVDGFKVLRGTIDARSGMKGWAVPSGTRRFSPVGGFVGTGLEGFSAVNDTNAYDPDNGTIGAGMHFAFGGIGSSLNASDCHTMLLKLAAVDNLNLWDPKVAPADANFSRAYRYLRASTAAAAQPSFAPWIVNAAAGYPYQDYNYSVPFSAWDMDVDPPVRLAVGHMENNVTSGFVDGRYWPGVTSWDNSVAREFAFIFRSPYTETPDPAFMVNLANNATTPLMWVMTCARRADVPWVSGDEFLIVPYHYPTSQDAWVFNPSVVLGVNPTDTPASFVLMQNYPNPFNPSTTIRYDLPAQSAVTITVYDILGRAVRRLVQEVQPAGAHALLWRGDNDAGGTVASGVYFYRCTIQRVDHNGQFDQTMKMILVK